MNTELPRIKELQVLKDEFNVKLEEALKEYKSRQSTEENQMAQSTPLSPILKNKKKIRILPDLFQPIPPWKPNCLTSKLFEKDLKILRPKHFMTDWENDRSNLLPRSYEKEENMLAGKNFVCRSLFGDYFNKAPHSKNNDLSKLSPLGKEIIGSFIENHEKREIMLLKREKEAINQLRKRNLASELNHWKRWPSTSNEFSNYPADMVVSYKKERKYVVLNKHPYRIPKRDGDYFDKEVKLL